ELLCSAALTRTALLLRLNSDFCRHLGIELRELRQCFCGNLWILTGDIELQLGEFGFDGRLLQRAPNRRVKLVDHRLRRSRPHVQREDAPLELGMTELCHSRDRGEPGMARIARDAQNTQLVAEGAHGRFADESQLDVTALKSRDERSVGVER